MFSGGQKNFLFHYDFVAPLSSSSFPQWNAPTFIKLVNMKKMFNVISDVQCDKIGQCDIRNVKW